MSGFYEGRDEAMNRGGGVRQPPVIVDGFPLLSEALQGRYDEKQGCYVGKAYTLCMWQEGSVLKFCLGSGDEFPKFFSTIDSLDSGLEQVELCLKTRKGSWVEPKPPKLR